MPRSASRPMTSPVERISGDSKISWPWKRLNGKTDSFKAQYFGRIAGPLRPHELLGVVRGEAVRRLLDFQLVEHRREELSVLGDLDALRRGADDVDAVFLQAKREIQRRLSAELRNRAPAFLPFVNVQHVFERKRFEK